MSVVCAETDRNVDNNFIDHVPACAAALVPASETLDMIVHHLDELGLAEVASGHPVWKLAVPNQVVAVDLGAVGGGVVDISVCVFELPIRQHFHQLIQVPRTGVRTVKLPRSGSVDSHCHHSYQHSFIYSVFCFSLPSVHSRG